MSHTISDASGAHRCNFAKRKICNKNPKMYFQPRTGNMRRIPNFGHSRHPSRFACWRAGDSSNTTQLSTIELFVRGGLQDGLAHETPESGGRAVKCNGLCRGARFRICGRGRSVCSGSCRSKHRAHFPQLAETGIRNNPGCPKYSNTPFRLNL